MTPENFEQMLEELMSRQPFKPFVIELHGGRRFEIDHPRATAFHEGAAVFIAPGGVPIYFDNLSVNQIIDAPGHAAPGKSRRKKSNGK